MINPFQAPDVHRSGDNLSGAGGLSVYNRNRHQALHLQLRLWCLERGHQELFLEAGDLKQYSIHYDRRSKVTTEIIFSRLADALAVVKRWTIDTKYHIADVSIWMAHLGVSFGRRSEVSTSSKYFPTSRRVFRRLKDYARKLSDVDAFTQEIEHWVLGRTSSGNEKGKQLFRYPFLVDELQKLDYALEGILFQQLFRMPYCILQMI
ncbi:PREDICTED: uncharacterized protein LOC104588848 [Nelumbo nucifera]|uniref:Uncharacterized protein LOC104588848 n=2 Tax=Nelumbo nucifera TaxID=4432 RepID=A0A1U7Z3H9_NELNU|nr:PREDICTED: uncharacterized protein LOC104588848 [Nelumbo nucifera]DAD22593.1 TPA_asm: hypothetical protein HUJ06_024056 [Nelumbo nucifera]